MEWVQVTWDLYRKVFSQGAALAARNWPVLGTLFLYSAIMLVGAQLAGRLGLFGGLLLSLLWAACVSSFLSLVETMIRTTRVTLSDLRDSFGAHLGDVIGVTFVFWLFISFAAPALLQLPQGPLLLLFVNIAGFVFFNAVPELIYLGHFSVPSLLRESYLFITDNWIEWFPVTFALILAYSGINLLVAGGLPALVSHALVAALAYFGMVVRGLLFLELSSSTRRGRAFRFRAR